PFDHMFSDVRGTLKVENKIVATKSLGVLFPRQRRTVTFEQWTPPRPGTFPVLIELAGKGPGGRPLTSTATAKITVNAAARAGVRLGAVTIHVPVAQPVLASGVESWKPAPGCHDARVVVRWGARSGSAQERIAVGSRDAIARVGMASLIRRASFSLRRLVLSA